MNTYKAQVKVSNVIVNTFVFACMQKCCTQAKCFENMSISSLIPIILLKITNQYLKTFAEMFDFPDK